MKKLLLTLCVVLAGCSTTSKGYKNPEFASYRMTTTAVNVTDDSEFGVDLENRIVKALNKAGVHAYGTRDVIRFANGRQDMFNKIWSKGAADILIIQYGDASQESTNGYQVSGSTTAYGNTAYSSGNATPIKTFSRDMLTHAAVVTRDDHKVWEANTSKHATGLLFVGDGSMKSGSVDALIDALRDDGLID